MDWFLKTRLLMALSLVWNVLVAGSSWAAEMQQNIHYYASVYSYDDGVLNLPRNAHSFAGFMAIDHDSQTVVERFAISWLPMDGRVFAFEGIERGRNYTLPETFQNASSRGLDLLRFGPREVTADFFMNARKQWIRLEQATEDGSILYKALDGDLRYRCDYPVINCMHALTGIVGDLELGWMRGRKSSAMIDRFFAPYYIAMTVSPMVFQTFLNFESGAL